MYQVNDYIVYGNHGVCKILEIGTPDIVGIDKSKLYYTLQPVYSKGRTIYTLIDNEKTIMRKILTKEEALNLIDDIPSIDLIKVANDKLQEAEYKTLIRKCDCRAWLKVIKTLYAKNQKKISEGKKIGSTDLKFLHEAEEYLYGELSIPLNIPRENMEDYITNRLSN